MIVEIHVDKIPQEGLEIKGEVYPSQISLDLSEQGLNFIEPISVGAGAVKSGNDVFVDIKVEAPVEYTCSRCLAKVQDVFKRCFNVNYETKPGDIIKIDEDIRQELFLNYPIKVLCRPDCKGLCCNCGQNLNVAKCECAGENREQNTDNRGE